MFFNSFFFVFTQQNKPVYFFDINDTQIPKNVFIKKSSKPNSDGIYYLRLNFENDTCVIKKIVFRKTYGKLNQSDFENINSDLNEYNFKPLSDFTIIQYHPSKDNWNSGRLHFKGKHSDFNATYLGKLKKKNRSSFDEYSGNTVT